MELFYLRKIVFPLAFHSYSASTNEMKMDKLKVVCEIGGDQKAVSPPCGGWSPHKGWHLGGTHVWPGLRPLEAPPPSLIGRTSVANCEFPGSSSPQQGSNGSHRAVHCSPPPSV